MVTKKDEEEYGLLHSDELLPISTPTQPASIATKVSSGHRSGPARALSNNFMEEGFLEEDTRSGATRRESNRRDSRPYRYGLGVVMYPINSRDYSSTIQPPPFPFAAPRHPVRVRRPNGELYMSFPSLCGLSGDPKFDEIFKELDTTPQEESKQHAATYSTTSPPSPHAPCISARSEKGLLSSPSKFDEDLPFPRAGYAQQHVGGLASIAVLFLAIFSTSFSGVFLVIALKGPRWGQSVSNDGILTPSTAATLTSLFAKLVEMSFVTVVVAFVGQALARRAFKAGNSRGVTLAEISMRTWIMQPGTLLTQWESVRYAGLTVLGLVSLLAALLAIFYTSAATTLVQPQLKYSAWESMSLQGLVKTQFANPHYIGERCQTPITESYDPEYYATTCLQLQHVSMAFHNYYGYLETWTDLTRNGTGSKIPSARPKGFAILNDNTTITTPWVEKWHSNVTSFNDTIPRYINNFTMAMPHVGVIQAAIDPVNGLMQPNDVEGATYSIIASVPSAIVNVLCTTLIEDDLRPFVAELWPGGMSFNQSTWATTYSYPQGAYPYVNGTSLDHIFGFGPDYGSMRYPVGVILSPVFPKLPVDYNTIVNDTSDMAIWGRSTLYLLGKGGRSNLVGNNIEQYYSMCQIQVGMTPNCSTHYNASSAGATLEAVCEDPDDPLAYAKSNPHALSGNATVNQDWPNIGSQWIKAISLNDGVFDGNGSNARLLTQFMVTTPEYSPALPSMAEALAVMAGCTLIMSLSDSPFQDTWTYTLPTIDPGHYQSFNASVRVQQYASGGVFQHQKVFHVVLFGVFIMSAVALTYFIAHRHWYTDFGEPINLFSLAVNSPPSRHLASEGGGIGPKGEQFKISWKLNRDESRYYIESQEPRADAAGSPGSMRLRWTRQESRK